MGGYFAFASEVTKAWETFNVLACASG